jgi:hypothetical protein
MDLKAWREKRKGEPFELPSGLKVVLRRCNMIDLAAVGGIPAPLAGLADKMLTGFTVSAADFQKYADGINLVVKACLVEPPAADAPDETHIDVNELTMKDRLAIYDWANQGVAELKPFRDGSEPAAAG